MKTFLLTAGERYYPCSGTRNWINTFETKELAEAAVQYKEGRYGDQYIIDEANYDWYKIIDLSSWINR